MIAEDEAAAVQWLKDLVSAHRKPPSTKALTEDIARSTPSTVAIRSGTGGGIGAVGRLMASNEDATWVKGW